jgi:hypothetical protein
MATRPAKTTAPEVSRSPVDEGVEVERFRLKEQWLREELRASRTQLLGQMQWGITVLAAVGINLYYIRKDVHAHLVQQAVITPQEILPFTRWFLGTFFLLVLAWVFTALAKRLSSHHGVYRQQLIDMDGGYSGIRERVPRASFLYRAPFIMFFSIPAIDLLTWALFYAGERLRINILIPW